MISKDMGCLPSMKWINFKMEKIVLHKIYGTSNFPLQTQVSQYRLWVPQFYVLVQF